MSKQAEVSEWTWKNPAENEKKKQRRSTGNADDLTNQQRSPENSNPKKTSTDKKIITLHPQQTTTSDQPEVVQIRSSPQIKPIDEKSPSEYVDSFGPNNESQATPKNVQTVEIPSEDVLWSGAVWDDDYPMDSEGNLLLRGDIPLQFYKKDVKNKTNRKEDLHRTFNEKFSLNQWNEYFGRSLIGTCCFYLIMSLLIVGCSIGLYFIVNDVDPAVPIRFKRNRICLYLLLGTSVANFLVAILAYVIVLWNLRRLIPYLFHLMLVIVLLFLYVSLWAFSEKNNNTPTNRDYISYIVASIMYDSDPEMLENVWPTSEPDRFVLAQRSFSCCGYMSVDDWNNFESGNGSAQNSSTQNSPTLNELKECNRTTNTFEQTRYNLNGPCESILKNDASRDFRDIYIFCAAFAFLQLLVFIGLYYLLFLYIREVNTWDGEVRMKLFRENHKSYLKYLCKYACYCLKTCPCLCWKIFRLYCLWCKTYEKTQVYPDDGKSLNDSPRPNLVGPHTHFEVWHTETGAIINVVDAQKI